MAGEYSNGPVEWDQSTWNGGSFQGGGGDSSGVFVPAPTPEQQMQNQAAPSWLAPEDYTANGFTPQGNSVAADQAATAAAKDLYEAILHRPPDAGGLEANKNAILAGSSIAELAKNMLASEEQQTFINRAKTNLISLGKKPAEVDAMINDYTKNIIDTAGAVVVSPIGYNGAIKVLDGSTMVSPGFFQRPDGSIININTNTGDIISATPPYSTYNDSVQINTGYKNNTYSKGTMDGQTSIKINGIDVPLITPEYLVNPKGQLLVSKEKLPVTIQSIEPPKKFNDGLGGVGDFLNGPGGLAIMLSLATAGAASGVALAATAAGGSTLAAGTTLTSLIGGAVGLEGVAATVAGGAILGSSTSALMAAATGGNVMQAAIKGAIGGGVGAASLGIANALMPEGSIQAIASATGQTVNQVSNIITNAISTSVSAAATGNFNGNVLSLIGTSLGSSVLANYASNIVNSLDPGNLNNVAQAVKAVTQVGTSAALSGQNFSTAVVNNAGQIIGNYISSTIGTTLKNSAGAVADKLGTAVNTLLDANGQPTNDSSKATSISLGDGKAIPLETYKTAYQDELKTQYPTIAGTTTGTGNVLDKIGDTLISSAQAAEITPSTTAPQQTAPGYYKVGPDNNWHEYIKDPNTGKEIDTNVKLAGDFTAGPSGSSYKVSMDPESGVPNISMMPVKTPTEPTKTSATVSTKEQLDAELASGQITPQEYKDSLSLSESAANTPTADQNYLNNSWSDFLQGLTSSPSAYDTSGLTAYTGGDVVPTPGATPGTGTTPGDGTGTGPGGTGPGGTGPGGTGPGGTGPGGTGPGGTGPGGTGPGGTGTITVPGTPGTKTPGTKTPGTKTTTTRTPGGITTTPIMPTIPQFGMSDITDLTPGLTKATPFQFADNPTFTNQLTPMPTQSNTDHTQQILNAATGGSTTPDIVDLKPGLTEKRTFKFADEPSFTSALNQIPSQSFTDYTQQILNAAHGGLIHMATGGDLPEYPEAPSPFLPAHTVRGRRRFNFFDGAHLPGYTREEYAEGGDVEGHNPEFFSEGGLESMENRFVRGDGDGTSDSVPAMLANGEFVIPADVVSKLGNGSNDSGAEILDEFLAVIREHNQKHNPRELPPDSRGPLAYLSEAKRKVG